MSTTGCVDGTGGYCYYMAVELLSISSILMVRDVGCVGNISYMTQISVLKFKTSIEQALAHSGGLCDHLAPRIYTATNS